jgi:ATP synthase protein I
MSLVCLRKISQARTFLPAMGDRDDKPVTDSAEDRESTRPTPATSPAMLAGAGIEFLGAILIGVFAGQWLDKKLGTAPWLLLLGTFLGAAAGFVHLIRTLTTAQRRAKSREQSSSRTRNS